MSRPPFTLWRMIFAELAKLTLLSASVLVVIIAMGGAIKPLTDGLLEPRDALTFIALLLVPMLAYVLPFAAGFASTLTYHRLGTTNEATAAYAGGVPHRTLLAPALAMGLLLALALGLLNELVIPRFLREAQKLITVDVPRLLAQEVDRGRSVKLDDWLIFADRGERVTPDPASGAIDQVEFARFAAVRLDSSTAEPRQEVTAQRATLWLYPPGAIQSEGGPGGALAPAGAGEDDSVVVLELENVVGGDRTGIGGFRDTSQAIFHVRNVFKDNPKFLSSRALLDLRQRPERMNWIQARRVALLRELGALEAWSSLDARLRESGEATLSDPRGRAVTIQGSGLVIRDGLATILPARGDRERVIVSHTRGGSDSPVPLRSEARTAVLRTTLATGGAEDGAPRAARGSFSLELHDVRTSAASGVVPFGATPDEDGSLQRASLTLTGLRTAVVPGSTTALPLASLPTPQLLAQTREAATSAQAPASLARAHTELERRVNELLREALSKRQERLAYAAGVLVITLTGAVTALLMSQRLPLTTYLWTFIPGLVCLATVSGGQQLVEQRGAPGLLLLWAGVAALLLYTATIYARLRRH